MFLNCEKPYKGASAFAGIATKRLSYVFTKYLVALALEKGSTVSALLVWGVPTLF
jgi:hypothetical protein